MRLAKAQLDFGLFCEEIEPMLAFFSDTVGLRLDGVLPVTKTLVQHRFESDGSIVKVNHTTGPLGKERTDGYSRLRLARADTAEPMLLANGVELVPTGHEGITQAAVTIRVRDPEAHRQFYADALGLTDGAGGSTQVGDSLIVVEGGATSVADAQLEGHGWRYITFQVYDVDGTHADAIRGGAREAMPPTTLGTTARISMILDPDGNWIELSNAPSGHRAFRRCPGRAQPVSVRMLALCEGPHARDTSEECMAMPRTSDARERMIQSTARLFLENGVQGTSFSDVLERSGAPRGSIYHHFKDGKLQLAQEATAYAGDVMAAAVTAAFAEDDPVSAIATFSEWWSTVLRESDFASGCPILSAATEGDRAPGARDAAGAAFASWETTIAASLRRRGVVRARAASLATLLIAAIEGAIVLSRAQRSTKPMELVSGELRALLSSALIDADDT